MSAPLRVGTVPYLVGRPLDLGLAEQPGIELVRAVPARLVAGLRDGSLDVALVSSIELYRQPGYRYLDGIAVCGRGFVGSVQVFLRKPIEAVGSIALDPASRTAAALVQVLLADRPGGPPEFVATPEGADPREAGTDAWLRIGDAALREHLADERLAVFNPSEVWTRRTGLPFVFAPWIVRPGAEIEPHLPAFANPQARGAPALERLARESSADSGLAYEACLHYLAEECTYELPASEMVRSLAAFGARAAALGLCLADAHPRPIAIPQAHAQTDR